jgi:sugar lactone lactonase YvrE
MSSLAVCQNYLVQPESVVYDEVNERYLVSNWGNGNIIQIEKDCITQSIFNSQLTCAGGLEIVGNTVYAASNSTPVHGVAGFDLTTRTMNFSVDIDGLALATDLTSDNSGYLYLSDVTSNRVYKISISEQTYTTFVSSGLSDPNGLLFDEDDNRLLVCSNGDNSPIQAISLTDSTVSVVVPTSHGRYDGLTEDNDGYIYVSSWGFGTVHRWDSEFNDPMELISSGHAGAADIYFNKIDNVLCVPNIGSIVVIFIYFDDTDGDEVIDINDNCLNDPNPDQEDFDDDDVGNVCDNCPEDYNPNQEDNDDDNIGDVCDYVCGDLDDNGDVDILDIVYFIDWKFKDGPEPTVMMSANVNNDESVDILDIVHMIDWKFKECPSGAGQGSCPPPVCP